MHEAARWRAALTERDGPIARLRNLTGRDAPDEARRKAILFRQLFAALYAVEAWDSAAQLADDPSLPWSVALAALATLAAVLAAPERWHRAGLALLAACVAIQVVVAFPATANHHYLLLCCATLLLLLRVDIGTEVEQLTGTLRALFCIALFYAGAQKLAWGYYFDGEFLAFAAARLPRFAAVLAPLVPDGELARLASIPVADGAGPFRIASVPFVLASNLAYVAELTLPPLLLVPRLRRLGVALVVAYFAAIEAAAREVFFGGLMVLLVLLFCSSDALRRARALYAVALAYVLAMVLGLLPRWEFT